MAPADRSGIGAESVDLVTVAQAMHWIEPASFYEEARRVSSRGGSIAIWGYGDPLFDDRRIHDVVHAYNRGTVETYWKPERQLLLDGYRGIPFPFREVESPHFELEVTWNLPELAGYLRTWSATVAYANDLGSDPIVGLEQALAPRWGKKEERHRIRWPLFLRAGRI